jgi:RHS repeat-associated protein
MNDALQEITDDATGTTLASYYRDAVGRVVAETTPVSTVYRIHKDSFPLLEVAATGRREFTEGHQPGAVFHAAMAGEDYWCLYDGLNSMRLLTNASGNLVAVPVYRPYGVAEDNELALSPLRFGFASMWYTPDLPFYHSERRSYYPAVGRHLQRDPAGLVDDVNLYTYVGNNPTNYVDPTGTKIVLPSDEDARLRVLRGLQELTDDLLGMRKSKSGEYQVEVVATAQFPPGDKPDRPVGTLLVGSLIDSEQTITIDLGGSSETNRAGPRGRDAKITWGSKEVLVTGEGEASKLTETPAYISLGHELIHALRITEGRVAPAYALEHEFLDPRGRKVIETATLEELIVSGILTPEKKGKTGSLNLLRGNLLGGTVASDRLIRALEALVAKDRIKGSTITENTLREEHHLPLRIAYTSYTRLGELPELITH